MKYVSVTQIANKWGVAERTVRNYCKNEKIPNAFLTGKTWNIPLDALRPDRINKKRDKSRTLLDVLRSEKASGIKGGIYHKVQIEMTYNSNHMEGSRLTFDETRYIYETNTIGVDAHVFNVDDIVETVNHFRCIDLVIDSAGKMLSESFIKTLHRILKSGTSDSRKDYFAIGEYKRLPNEVSGVDTTLPEEVPLEMKKLVASYNSKVNKTFEDLIAFHVAFESIHPFKDGNGRVGRLILFKECLKNNIVPFIIDEEVKLFYYRGLKEWHREKSYLLNTCLSSQDKFKKYLDYFRIPYEK